ncbi:ParA family protein [Agrobacterium cavarae]|uniref:ParA family protein n=1 Tax=Agrobacterium cavarae TaxID=2528239 RepID=UPI002FD9154A
MPVVGFISEKGGVGKTTACYHMAIALSRYHKKKVLVIDADYQRGGVTGRFFPNLIEAFRDGTLPDETLFTKYQQLYSASSVSPSITVRKYTPDNVDVIIADKRLASVTTDKLPSTNNLRENNLSILSHLKVISDIITDNNLVYDYILIDSHPEISDVLRSIIYVSDYCVSPVKLDLQSAIGVPTIVSEITSVNDDVQLMKSTIAPQLVFTPTAFAGAIGMMAREWGGTPKQSEREELRRLRSAGTVFKNYVTEGDGLRRAAQERLPVFNITGANADKQSMQLKKLTVELLAKCP